MVRAGLILTAILGLAACDNSVPAGGRGYFDPAPPAPILRERVVPVPVPQQPTYDVEPPVPGDPNAALAQDVTRTLEATRQTQPPVVPAGQIPPAAGPVAVEGDMGIDPNDESINLSLTPQEIQKQQREVAARRREAAQQQLVIVAPEPVPQQNINANVVKFARETTHPKGTKMYNRPAFRSRTQSASVCRRFESADEAQRQFLSNGGPTTDRYNLDPDGDGFACSFDPEKYRKLSF